MEYQLEGKGGLGESRGGWRIGRQLVLWELPPQCQAAPGSTTEQGAPGTALNQSRPGKWTENRGTLSQPPCWRLYPWMLSPHMSPHKVLSDPFHISLSSKLVTAQEMKLSPNGEQVCSAGELGRCWDNGTSASPRTPSMHPSEGHAHWLSEV